MRAWWARVAAAFGRSALDDDLREELDTHLQMEVDEAIGRGARPDDARQAAARRFGNTLGVRESARAAWTFTTVEDVLLDLEHALRILRRSPGFSFAAVFVIALGVGAATAAFTLLDHVLLRPLRFPDASRLVRLYETEIENGYPRIEASAPNIVDWQAMTTAFSSMGAYSDFVVNVSGQGEPVRVEGAIVASEALETLGVAPAFGRPFGAADQIDGHDDVLLLSDGFATALYGNPAAAVGRTIDLDQVPHTVVGVMPASFVFPSSDTLLWKPFPFSDELMSLRRNHVFDVVGRLRPGVTLREARADMDRVAAALRQSYPKENEGVGATVVEMRDVVAPQSRLLVVAVFGAALSLLLIACSNLANLLFARALLRAREMAVRIAIGAGRARVVRQLLAESLVLALLGGLLGAALAIAATPLLARLVPANLPIDGVPTIDWRVLAFAAALTLATSVAFGLGPALRSWRTADLNALRSRTTGGGSRDPLRSMLVLAEVAGTVTLLVTAGLLVKALWRVQSVDPGFRSKGVITLRTALPERKYPDDEARRGFYDRVLFGARTLPGVEDAAYTTAVPMVFGAGIFPVTVAGLVDDPNTAPRVGIRFVSTDYFSTLRIPIRAGSDFTASDMASEKPVAIISESLARRIWADLDAVGRTLTVAGKTRTVVGVVGDIMVRGLERASEPQLYMPGTQVEPFTFYAPKDLVVRTAGDPPALVAALRAIVHEADPEQAVSDIRSLDDIVAAQTSSRRDLLGVLGAITAIAFLLAGIGIHGLLSFMVSARTSELGVRMALGAARGQIVGMFVRQGLVLGLGGILLAIPLSYAAARGLRAVLFGVDPADPAILLAAALLAFAMTLAGSLRPAIRAAVIDPATTIRTE
jgi:putative ABC transport system permease protein